MSEQKFHSLKEFYPFYLSQHQNFTCRILHFIGTTGVILLWIMALLYQNWNYFALSPILGYGFAWLGHFFFEKNKPATFQYPFYSLASDFILFWELLIRKQNFKTT